MASCVCLIGKLVHRARVGRLLLASAGAIWPMGQLLAQPSPTAITDRLRTYSTRAIDFHAAAFPESVYVGQQITYQVAVLLNADARSRLRRNPEFLPPELRGLLAYELGTPRRVPPRSYGSDVYEAHVFQRALFAVAAGTLTVPSPQLSYSLPQSASYFSREERFSVSAESAQLVIKSLPETGRPVDFTGAVGDVRVTASLDAQSARVGDPLVLTVRVEGIGNVKLLPRPTVEVSWASVVPGTDRVQVDTSGAYVRGIKEFEYILTPSQSGAAVLPVVRYSYFDPFKGQYAVATTAPADLTIAEGSVVATDETEEGSLLPLREWRREQPLRLERLSPWVGLVAIMIALLLPLGVIAWWFTVRRARRIAPVAPTGARTMTAATSDDVSAGGIARQVRRTLLGALAPRLQVPLADLVSRADVQRVLRRRGVTRETTREVLTLLDELALRGFGPGAERDATATSASDRSTLESRSAALMQRVNGEAVQHGRTRLWSRRLRRAGTIALVIASALARPAQPASAMQATSAPSTATSETANAAAPGVAGSDDVNANREAEAAYAGRRFPRAAARYEMLVARRPDDVDLLVNWGTAAWAAADTVSAVVAWQRAARLDPLAPDIQERFGLLPPGARVGIAAVAMIPVAPLAVAAALLWIIGWGVLVFVLRRPPERPAPAGVRAAAVVMILAAISAAGTAGWGDRALDASTLAVVRRPESMRATPGYDANTVGGLTTGDVVRLVSAREGWVRVQHADGRAGWIPRSRLVGITAPLVAADRFR
jgi:hypothetical protein